MVRNKSKSQFNATNNTALGLVICTDTDNTTTMEPLRKTARGIGGRAVCDDLVVEEGGTHA